MRNLCYISIAIASMFQTAHASEPDMPSLATEAASCTAIYLFGAATADMYKHKTMKRRLTGLGKDAFEASKFIASSFAHEKAAEFVEHAVQMEMIRLESTARNEDEKYYPNRLRECLEYEEAWAELLEAIKK